MLYIKVRRFIWDASKFVSSAKNKKCKQFRGITDVIYKINKKGPELTLEVHHNSNLEGWNHNCKMKYIEFCHFYSSWLLEGTSNTIVRKFGQKNIMVFMVSNAFDRKVQENTNNIIFAVNRRSHFIIGFRSQSRTVQVIR